MQKQLQCFILWENARKFEKEILEDIRKHFKIIKIYEIHWDKEFFAQNMSRFYGKKLKKARKKLKESGSGPFLFVPVLDEAPKMSEGKNYNTMLAKATYRKMLSEYGDYLVHASDTVSEADENMRFALGIGADEFLKNNQELLDNTNIIPVVSGIPAENGWKNKSQLLNFVKTLNDVKVISSNSLEFAAKNPALLARYINAKKRLFSKRKFNLLIAGKKVCIQIAKL